ncbi:hypothetical protein, partial [Mycoplasmopsis bovis]|uniref:hypothetical protein n=1 Tax=Mycoplasmopsis bovis TaxID=28903 RepID=UPI003D28F85F
LKRSVSKTDNGANHSRVQIPYHRPYNLLPKKLTATSVFLGIVFIVIIIFIRFIMRINFFLWRRPFGSNARARWLTRLRPWIRFVFI